MIRVLSPRVVDKIAAGEVIERPASVVKELVENSIDAGAGRVEIEVEGAGSRRIRVSDDGCGMTPEALALAFVTHATSKLSSVEDLEEIASLGFRGEALASIGAVSRARIRSRPSGSDAGASIEDRGGVISTVQAVGMPIGTVVEARDLFFNTPARRKFLKSEATESAQIVEVVSRLALAHPGISFRLRREGRLTHEVAAEDDLATRVRGTYGSLLGENLVSGEASWPWGQGALFVGRPEQARRRARIQLSFVNGRPVRDRMLVAAIRQGFAEFLAESLQPAFVLFLTLPPADVDVNVHPTKAEVRFRRGRDIFGDLMHAVRGLLQGVDLTARPRLRWQRPAAPRGRETTGSGAAGRGLSLFGSPAPEAGDVSLIREEAGPLPGASGESGTRDRTAGHRDDVESPSGDGSWASGRILQVHGTYLLYESPDGLVVVDQHALHERLVYNRLRRQFARGRVLSQKLISPQLVDVSREQVAVVKAAGELLSSLGVDLRPFGETTVALGAVPAILDRHDPEQFVAEILDVIEGADGGADRARLVDGALARMACHRAVRGGDRLSEAAARELLRAAEADDLDQACPHGRPTRVLLPVGELERLFKRRGF